MKINENEIRDYIRKHYEETHSEFYITERIINRITPIVFEGLANAPENISMDAAAKAIDMFLEKNNVLEFINKRQPNMNSVPEEIIQSLNKYFEDFLLGYELSHVYRKSNYQEEDYLYCVTAKNIDEHYACWSSWNARTRTLNQGHLNLHSETEAIHILLDLFNDVTDEPEKYGMLLSGYECPHKKSENQEEKTVADNIIEYQRHNRCL